MFELPGWLFANVQGHRCRTWSFRRHGFCCRSTSGPGRQRRDSRLATLKGTGASHPRRSRPSPSRRRTALVAIRAVAIRAAAIRRFREHRRSRPGPRASSPAGAKANLVRRRFQTRREQDAHQYDNRTRHRTYRDSFDDRAARGRYDVMHDGAEYKRRGTHSARGPPSYTSAQRGDPRREQRLRAAEDVACRQGAIRIEEHEGVPAQYVRRRRESSESRPR